MRDTEAARETTARMRVRARSVLSGLLLGGLIGATAAIALAPPQGARFEARQPWVVAAPSAQDWPRTPRAGERVRLDHDADGATLVVTGADAAGARSLARAFAGWQSPGAPTLEEALARLRLEWKTELSESPPHRTPVAECASILFARAIWGRTLADRLPIPSSCWSRCARPPRARTRGSRTAISGTASWPRCAPSAGGAGRITAPRSWRRAPSACS